MPIDFPAGSIGTEYTYNGVTYVFDGLAWQIKGAGSSGGYEYPIDQPPATPNAWDDEFTGGTLNAAWTEYLPTTPSGYGSLVSGGAYTVYAPLAADVGGRFAGIHKATAGTGTYIICMEHGGLISMYRGLYFGVSNAASTAHYLGVALYDNTATGNNTVYMMLAPNVTSGGSATDGSTVPGLTMPGQRLYVRFVIDSTTVTLSVSTNGRYFTPIQAVTISAYLGNVGRVWVGMHRYANGAYPYSASVLWARKVA